MEQDERAKGRSHRCGYHHPACLDPFANRSFVTQPISALWPLLSQLLQYIAATRRQHQRPTQRANPKFEPPLASWAHQPANGWPIAAVSCTVKIRSTQGCFTVEQRGEGMRGPSTPGPSLLGPRLARGGTVTTPYSTERGARPHPSWRPGPLSCCTLCGLVAGNATLGATPIVQDCT